MDCDFCFSEWRDQDKELDTKQAKNVIQYVNRQGLEAINFTGGEPLLRQDVGKIIRFTHDLGLTTILSTNGILLERRIKELADHIDYIGLPLDSSREEIHNYIRPTKATSNHHGMVLGLIDLINENYNHIGLKINTIVTKENADSIVGIGDLVEGKAMSWKLSHFIPSGYGRQFKDKYEISKTEYSSVVEQCRSAYPGINIISSDAYQNDDSCRIISAEGHLLKPGHDGLEDMGKLEEITRNVMLDDFNQAKNERLFRKTYSRKK